MKMQALESQLSIATTDKDNLDKQLTSLVNIPTKLEEISSQGVRQISVGSKHVLGSPTRATCTRGGPARVASSGWASGATSPRRSWCGG